MSITRTALAHGSGRIVLFYANRDETVGDLRRGARGAGRRAPRPAGRRALARVGAGAAHPGAAEGVHRAVPDVRRVRVRPGAVHEADRSRRCASWSSRASGGTRRSSSRWAATRSATPSEQAEAEHELEEADSDTDFDRGRRARAAEPAEGAPQGNVRLEVELDGETYAFDDWAPTTKLLEHLESKGVKAPYSCREGECSACAVRLLEGEVEDAATTTSSTTRTSPRASGSPASRCRSPTWSGRRTTEGRESGRPPPVPPAADRHRQRRDDPAHERVDQVVLGGVHQRERHRHRVEQQQPAPPDLAAG